LRVFGPYDGAIDGDKLAKKASLCQAVLFISRKEEAIGKAGGEPYVPATGQTFEKIIIISK
jgi:hypothetical protein